VHVTRSAEPTSRLQRSCPKVPILLAIATVTLALAACASGTAEISPVTAPGSPAPSHADEFLVVDCLLPGQVRRLGELAVFLAPRRPIKTSARDCQIRGGEYVAFDRADYASALKVWLPLAEGGDAAAQTQVGEIFEKGLGVPPDYGKAAQWYQRAAERGYSRAAINLGSLYERGLGVSRDPTQAVNWYRRAAGLSDLRFEIAPAPGEVAQLRKEVGELRSLLEAKQAELDRTQRELDSLRRRLDDRSREMESDRVALASLRQQLAEQKTSAQATASEIRTLERSIAERETRLAAKDRELTTLRATLAQLDAESNAQRTEIARLKQEAAAAAPPAPRETGGRGADAIGRPGPKDVSFGTYHALVIGNNDYREFPRLETAVNDARGVARVLEKQYGFRVTLLINATRYDTLSRLNALRERLTSKDNLLIYYAGHGELDRRNRRGHWLPIDAERTSSANWISTTSVTDVLNAMAVQQLLVVADSCYAGMLTRSALATLEPGTTEEDWRKALQLMLQQRSRMVMTSGGVEPVIDNLGGEHSAFAKAFIALLETNRAVLSGHELFQLLLPQVTVAASRVDARQVPEYAPIQFAGHESGDFFFVRSR
jgi:hypothetical protein